MHRIKVWVTPRAKESSLLEINDGGVWRIKIKAPPAEGEANKELLQFLSRHLQIPISRIRIVHGFKSRHKTVEVD
ncbi:MAG TPA: DUF167 domain-containing protein [Patescibacteria group bacterium]|nr:DUF167 domain-containing protein [Patescibacteria group bacterium]